MRMANQLARKEVVMNTKMKKKITDDELIDVPPVEENEEVENKINKSADRPIDDLGEKLNPFRRKQERLTDALSFY